MSVLNRLEIDVMQHSEVYEAANIAYKYNLPGLVVHPALAADAHIARGRLRGRFKLITPVDWPKGENRGMNKMRGLSSDALEADGFEILLSPDISASDIKLDIHTIYNFIRKHVSKDAEIRFVLGTNGRGEHVIATMSSCFVGIPTPAYIRNDVTTKVQMSKANSSIHNQTGAIIHSILRVPLKISGNINNIKAITSCENATKFAVNLQQAQQILKEFNSNPKSLVQILNSEPNATN